MKDVYVSGSNAPIASLASEMGFSADQTKKSVWVVYSYYRDLGPTWWGTGDTFASAEMQIHMEAMAKGVRA